MPVEPLSLFTLPLVLSLVALFAAAAVYDFITFRRRRKNENKAVYRCDGCRHIYTALSRTPLARCPQCGKQNEPVRE
jgi:rRNA maturation endonuclease Nob1